MKIKNRTAALGFGLFLLVGCVTIIFLIRAIYSTPTTTLSIQSSPIPPNAMKTIIVQTGVAAASQTAGVSGTQTSQFYTPTFTLTTTPLGGAPINLSGTPLPGISTTATAYESPTLFILPKWTPSTTPTKKPRNGYTVDGKKTGAKRTQEAVTELASSFDDNAKHLACNVLSRSPTRNAAFSTNQDFTVKWALQNAGAGWNHNSVDIAYGSGSIVRFADVYNLGVDVDTWQKYTVQVPMRAPATPGNYSATWTLREGAITFCEMTVSIIAQ